MKLLQGGADVGDFNTSGGRTYARHAPLQQPDSLCVRCWTSMTLQRRRQVTASGVLERGAEHWIGRKRPWSVVSVLTTFLILAVISDGAIAQANTLTTLYSFAGASDGDKPTGTLVQGSDGSFYGTTRGEGSDILATVFKITANGVLATLHTFNGTDGATPYAGLVAGNDGNFYGTTYSGGNNQGCNCGTVFKITPSGELTSLWSFDQTDGAFPQGQLLLGQDGNLYGTTRLGGAANTNFGTVFQITSGGLLTTLHSFTFSDGALPEGGLIQGIDGNLYGTTSDGGAFSNGTIFQITPGGDLTRYYSFNVSDGANPIGGVVQGTDGAFYGTTSRGGMTNNGTAFKITPSGVLTTLFSFDNNDGANPIAALVLGTDGDFYGTTSIGGANFDGTVFRLDPSGVLLTLHSFNINDGAQVYAGLVHASDGDFYGTTVSGGANGVGTVFRLSSGTALPSAPTNLAAVGGDGQVTLNWNEAAGALSYNIYQGTSPAGEAGTPIARGVTQTATTISGLTNGTTYYFTAKAINVAGVSPASNEASAKPQAPLPTAVTDLSAAAGPGVGQITLTWTFTANATSYSVYQGTATGAELSTPVSTGLTGATLTLGGLTAGITYYFRVAAVNGVGMSVLSNEASAATQVILPGSVLVQFAREVGVNSIQLMWDYIGPGPVTYNVYAGPLPGAESAKPYLTGVTDPFLTVNGLNSGTTYYFKIAAVSDAGAVGPLSNEVFAKTRAVTPPQSESSGFLGAASPWDLLLLTLIVALRAVWTTTARAIGIKAARTT